MPRPNIILLVFMVFADMGVFTWSRFEWPPPTIALDPASLAAATQPRTGAQTGSNDPNGRLASAMAQGEVQVLGTFYAAEKENRERLSLIAAVLSATVMANFFVLLGILMAMGTGGAAPRIPKQDGAQQINPRNDAAA